MIGTFLILLGCASVSVAVGIKIAKWMDLPQPRVHENDNGYYDFYD